MRRVLLLLLFLLSLNVSAGVGGAMDFLPQAMHNRATCDGIRDGMLNEIAYYRWHTTITEAQYLAADFEAGTPQWKMDLVTALIKDAFRWPRGEQDWVEFTYRECLGVRI